MKIAVIGGGISGLCAGYRLAGQHEVHLYEANTRLGGHTATVDVETTEEKLAIDTGFIVYNDRTYPEFIALMQELGIFSRPTSMSFSVSDRSAGLEYGGSGFNTLFAQRRNLFSPRYHRMLLDILRFNRKAEQHLAQFPQLAESTLGDYLETFGYSAAFRDQYLVPMGAAIWSSGNDVIVNFPFAFLVRFFRNHGLLDLRNRPQWRVIAGGSRNYIPRLSAPFAEGIRLASPVKAVNRGVFHQGRRQVCVSTDNHHEYYDEVILGCHSNQALRMLQDASPAEKSILSAIPYTRNEVVLHTDESLLPKRREVWSSWNVLLDAEEQRLPTLTYNMNILQHLQSRHTWCVTLNCTDAIQPEKIHGVWEFDHPLFSLAGLRAQQRWDEVNGSNQTWFCGAWWRNGFHEDGVWSAQRVTTALLERQPYALAMAG